MKISSYICKIEMTRFIQDAFLMSPTFLNEKGYRFFTWSKEEERKHIHVVQGDKQCKFWLEPAIELAENNGFRKFELNEILKIITKNETEFNEKWNKHFR